MTRRISLIDVDGKIPNLALMKLSAFHKQQGDVVEWFVPLFSNPDIVYASKVFTFTPDFSYAPSDTIKGGTGYNLETLLPSGVEHICPDYALYPRLDFSMGFLTRGCSKHCQWCVVPDKEGTIRPNADVEEFLRHDKVVLLDNNVLAHSHGIDQIAKLASLQVKIDFNQGLDASRIDASVARLLASCRWIRFVRLACDTQSQKPVIRSATNALRAAGYTGEILCYMLVKEIDDALDRSEFLRALGVEPFAQAYRDFTTNTKPTRDQARFCRWVNRKAVWRSTKWEDYRRK